ncbi:hypothetical protein JXB31_05215 [Candidatus Woesearchaeota archaeon]|nr:hypothetical protein [Candidatus Woesearchaeota archaeon]
MVTLMSVSATGTRLNITLKEVVYNNVTFAENFYETESNPYCRIDGTLNITNPENDTIFDIYLVFYNMERMITDFIWSDGKPGNMSSGGAGTSYEYGEVGNNSDNLTLSQDLDNDYIDDTFWTNGTHVWFNLTNDGYIVINLSNSTTNPISIQDATANNVPIEMTEVAITKDGRSYGNLTIIGTATQDNILGSAINITIKEYYVSPIILHIPELRKLNYTTFTYNITCTNTDPPVNIETDYSNERHASIDRKVLAGYNWTINQRAINNFYLDLNVTNVNITMTAQTVIWNSTESNFSLEYLYGLGDYANVHGNGTSIKTWWWEPSGGTLENGTEVNITYRMTAPESVPFSATYLALIENITYNADFLMSNISLAQVNASAKINSSFEKRISQPADNEFSHNVTWEIRPHSDTPLNITFLLNKVTLWVTQDLNLMNYSHDSNKDEEINVAVDSDNNDYTLTIDLDGDLNSDYVFMNSTHALFNVSSMSGLQAVSLEADISAPPKAVSIEDRAIPNTYCYVTIDGSTSIADTIDAGMTFNVWCRLHKIYTGGPLATLNISTAWDPNPIDFWTFNYTDGSNSSYPPPIVWMKPEWLVSAGLGQILNYTSTISGQDLYLKYIYVVNGYWLQVQKNITNIAEDQYYIYTFVENIGNGWTPKFEKVTVYDFIPSEFEPYSWSHNPNANQSVGVPGSEFYGTSFVWDIPWKADMNSSLGPKNGPLATGWENYSWNVSYIVNGTGAYRITELYIVGLDPLKVDGASASPLIAVITGFQSHSKEAIYISIVVFLVVINLANLLITRKINNKLDYADHQTGTTKHKTTTDKR